MKKLSPRAKWAIAYATFPSLLLAGALGVWWARVDALESLRLRVFDSYMRTRPRPWDPDFPVRIIDIDDESIARLGQWPWPRTLLARLVRRLTEAGAASIAFDAVFAEPDRTSPEAMAARLPDDAEMAPLRARLKRLPRHDAVFAKAVSEGPVVLGYTLVAGAGGAKPERKAGIGFASKRPEETLDADLPDLYAGAVTDLPELEKGAAGNGCFSIAPDVDGVHRRIPMLFAMGGEAYPSLSAEALRVAAGARGYKVIAAGAGTSRVRSFGMAAGRQAGLSEMRVGRSIVPLDERGNLLLYDSGYHKERFIPVWKVLEPGFDPGLVRGRVLFVGTSAAGLKDERPTPLNPAVPGVEVHAQAAEQILSQTFVRRPWWADAFEGVAMGLFGAALILAIPRLGALWGLFVTAAAIGGACWGAFHLFVSQHLLFEPIYFSLVAFAVYLATSVLNHLRSESERKRIRGAFGQYLHPKLVEELAKHPEKLRLGGETREMTILFCDIRGFTTISEQYDAHGLTQVINRFLTPMSSIIMERLGYIDKYIGDCIMAFWNAPADDTEHAVNACRSALEMHRRLDELNGRWEEEARAEGRKHLPIHIGIGLNTGPCCVGNMGADMKFNYSVLGDDVNLASRLEGQSKSYGVGVVIGPKTREAAAAFAALELDLIRVKGKTVPVHIHTLLGDEALGADPRFKALAGKHAAMLAAYRGQRWDEADRLRGECGTGAKDLGLGLGKLYHLYEDRVAACRAAPPATDWDGVFTATTK